MGSIKELLRSYRSVNSRTDPSQTPLTREAVLWAYRLYLDREPESDRVVDEHLRKCSSTQDLRNNFIYSKEFRDKNPTLHVPVLSGDEPAMSIEEVRSEHDLQKLFDHTQHIWQELGTTEPHWSVVIADEYRQAKIQESKESFYRTGKQHVAQLFGSLERNGVQHSEFKICLDYGCGVGRITRHLSERFEQVFGYDISLSHLKCAEDYLSEENVTNVVLNHLKRLRDIEDLPKTDVAYSMLVLQHNPPPVIAFIMEGLIRALNPGGIAFFQVPTYRLGYSFSLANYFAEQAARREIEMHVLPQSSVFEIAQRAGGRVLEVIDDGWTGIRLKEVSNTFVIKKAI
ncbi:MAG TPA: class I SAM-dependent methyltransferase [Pyrinomonadaceae bacterium]|nr:class I SAM-dependent methyltransferase [Pyrinomonadaceae bacterium]